MKKAKPSAAHTVRTLRNIANEYRKDSTGRRALLTEAANLIERGEKMLIVANVTVNTAIHKLETILAENA